MSEQVTVDQHYVPRFYMKNFSDIIGSGSKEKVLISFFQFNGELYKEKIPVKSICYKNYFYGEDGVLEKELAKKEGIWANTILSIIESPEKELSKEQVEKIKEFATYQFGRTLATLNYSRASMSDALITGFMNDNPEYDKDIVSEIINKKVEEEADASLIVNICEQAVKELDDLAVAVIKFSTSNKLITSDMPVITTNPFSINKTGMANVGTVMFFPIASDILIAIYDDKMYTSLASFYIDNNEQDVINLNKYQILSAEERIMSKGIDMLKGALSDSEVLEKRQEVLSKRKIDSSYDGEGTFLAIKSRNMKFFYPVSIFKLPRSIQKMPVECREVFKRKYSYESRLSILCRIYKLPDLLKNQEGFSAGEIKKRKDGYSKLLSLMDNYWNVPKDERTITPELMYQLKTVPTTLFKLDE